MLWIGIHESDHLVYEGSSAYGRAVWPAPAINIATVIKEPDDFERIPVTNHLATKFVFREDYFDTVARIRRGRMYFWGAGQSQPYPSHVQPHPAYYRELAEADGRGWLRKELFSFQAWPAFRELGGPSARAMIALGTKDAYALWRVVDIERIVTGDDLITLRARSAMGVLPEINIAAIPAAGREKVLETLDKLLNSAHRAGAESTIDLARAAAQWCIGVWLADKRGDPNLRQEDLGRLANMLREEKHVSSHIGHVLAWLHSRAKPNEQERYESRALRDDDAEFALAAVRMLLRELGWSR